MPPHTSRISEKFRHMPISFQTHGVPWKSPSTPGGSSVSFLPICAAVSLHAGHTMALDHVAPSTSQAYARERCARHHTLRNHGPVQLWHRNCPIYGYTAHIA